MNFHLTEMLLFYVFYWLVLIKLMKRFGIFYSTEPSPPNFAGLNLS